MRRSREGKLGNVGEASGSPAKTSSLVFGDAEALRSGLITGSWICRMQVTSDLDYSHFSGSDRGKGLMGIRQRQLQGRN